MAPLSTSYPSAIRATGAQTANITGIGNPFFNAERDSWRSPEDILTFLMLIGGDIVRMAVAQLAGTGPGPFTPVAFSFGWLAYAVTALASALGDGRLLPAPDCPAQLINVQSGYARENKSWVLGRLLRDHEHLANPERSGLTIAFFKVAAAGLPDRDWVYWCGVSTIVAQLAIAVVPGILHGNWLVVIVTAGGTALALVGSGLGQWRDEKYAAREVKPDQRDVVCLTQGNGSSFAMVIISEGVGLKLEDLAGGRDKRSVWTSVMTAALCVLWVVLLLTVEGLDEDTWYMLAIGGLGMVQNVVAAGARRSAAALGIRFMEGGHGQLLPGPDKVSDGTSVKVMTVLQDAEKKELGLGIALRKVFFPGKLTAEEKTYWDEKEKAKDARETAKNAAKKERERKAGSVDEVKERATKCRSVAKEEGFTNITVTLPVE